MARVLCCCQEGNNRSVTVAHQLKYLGHDTIPVGLRTNSLATLRMLFEWADHIVLTDGSQSVPEEYTGKVRLWDVGPDRFPRPFNRELLSLVRGLVEVHRAELV